MSFAVNNFLLTDKGWFIPPAIPKDSKLFTHDGWRSIQEIEPSTKKSFLIVKTDTGHEITVIPEQRMAVRSVKSFKFLQAKNLQAGDGIFLLPGENVVFNNPESVPVTIKKYGHYGYEDKVNGPFNYDIAFLLGMYYAEGYEKDGCIYIPFRKYCAGCAFEIFNALNRESLGRYEYDETKDGTYWYTLKIIDKVFQDWLHTNKLYKGECDFPEFLFSSPSRTLSGFLAGQLLGSAQKVKAYHFKFSFPLRLMQLLFLREGIMCSIKNDELVFETERSQNEYDRLMAKSLVYKHEYQAWDQERFQTFYEAKIQSITEGPYLDSYQITVEGAEGVNMNGYYVGI